MLFNSYTFLFAFLPLLLVCWRLTQGYGPTGLALVLLAFSVVFYGLWGLPFLILLAVILGMNYAFALALAAPEPEPKQDAAPAENAEGDAEKACLCGSRKQAGCRFHLSRKGLLILALVLNLLPLLWFK